MPQAIPRINSRGQLFGAVYKVASMKQVVETVEVQAPPKAEKMQYLEDQKQ
jgi:hypothetical protein